MSETTTDNKQPATATVSSSNSSVSDGSMQSATHTAMRIVPDSECAVSLVRGKNLDSNRACFELALLGLNPALAARPTVTLPVSVSESTLVIQALTKSGKSEESEQSERPAIPESLALSAGLIAHGYVPEGWLCGLLTISSQTKRGTGGLTCLTTFDSQRIYGLTSLTGVTLSAESETESQITGLTPERLKRAIPSSIGHARSFEVLYLTHDSGDGEKIGIDGAMEKLSGALEILVEPLPAPINDLRSAGLRWISAEAC